MPQREWAVTERVVHTAKGQLQTDSQRVWVFVGRGRFPSGVFATRETAERWIARHGLKGCLTAYPLDEGVYDYVLRQGAWQPYRPEQTSPDFIGAFSSAYLEHYHYE